MILTVPKEWLERDGRNIYWMRDDRSVLVDKMNGNVWLIAPEIRNDGLTYRRVKNHKEMP